MGEQLPIPRAHRSTSEGPSVARTRDHKVIASRRFAQLDTTARSAKCPNETSLRQALNHLREVCAGELRRFGNFVDRGEPSPWWPGGQVKSRANSNLGSMSVKHCITQ